MSHVVRARFPVSEVNLEADEKYGVCKGASPFAGSLRVSLRYDFSPLPGQEGGQGNGRKSFSIPC